MALSVKEAAIRIIQELPDSDMITAADGVDWEPMPFHVEIEDGLVTLVPDRQIPPWTAEAVNDLIEAMRLEREYRVLGPYAPRWWLAAEAKAGAIEMIARMRDDVSFDDIMYVLFVRLKIERGLRDVEAGNTMSHEDMKREIDEWLRCAGAR